MILPQLSARQMYPRGLAWCGPKSGKNLLQNCDDPDQIENAVEGAANMSGTIRSLRKRYRCLLGPTLPVVLWH